MQYTDLKSDVVSNGEREHTALLLSRPSQSELHSTCQLISILYGIGKPVPVAARSKAWICGYSFAGIAGSNPARIMDECLLWVLCVVR